MQLPSKRNARGIEIDRAAPFAIRAVATLDEPAGPRRLIFRAKGWARLQIDGRTIAETGADFNASGHEEVPELAS
ncbi:MAG: hypothetical protein U0800_26265 [Isosphaeraceae bacterium]